MLQATSALPGIATAQAQRRPRRYAGSAVARRFRQLDLTRLPDAGSRACSARRGGWLRWGSGPRSCPTPTGWGMRSCAGPADWTPGSRFRSSLPPGPAAGSAAPGGVRAQSVDRDGRPSDPVHGDVLVAADGIHSTVRSILFPAEGPPRWNGVLMWRGATDWPEFRTGRSMIIAGGTAAKLVIYPIGEGLTAGTTLTNWAICVRTGQAGDPPPHPQDWSRPADPTRPSWSGMSAASMSTTSTTSVSCGPPASASSSRCVTATRCPTGPEGG